MTTDMAAGFRGIARERRDYARKERQRAARFTTEAERLTAVADEAETEAASYEDYATQIDRGRIDEPPQGAK